MSYLGLHGGVRVVRLVELEDFHEQFMRFFA
jgi:hypothetical protein